MEKRNSYFGKALVLFFGMLFLISFASAEIILQEQPRDVYNYGDLISVPVTVKTVGGVSGTITMDLLCSGKNVNFYKNSVLLSAGEEKRLDASLIVAKDFIGEIEGACKVKISLSDDYILTEDFEISHEIAVTSTTKRVEFNPGESILIKGDATKRNGNGANGFLKVRVGSENSTDYIEKIETVQEGFFSVNVTFPKGMKAGSYLVKIDAYEVDSSGSEINSGYLNYNIKINQIPTTLEIFSDSYDVEPGTDLEVKAILHDQTGEKIPSTAIITVKKSDTGEILIQKDVSTDSFLKFPIPYNEPPANLTVVAVSSKIMNEAEMSVIEKKDISVELHNETIFIKNTGNVLYNDSALIKIGNQTLNVPIFLEVDEVQEFKLSAPDGEYQVEFLSGGESRLTESVTLTGKAVEVRSVGEFRPVHFFVWIFLILILGIAAFIFFKKGYQRTLFGKIHFKKKQKVNSAWENRALPLSRSSLVKSKNKGVLSLSIKGEKQVSSVVCLHLDNLHDLQGKKSSAEEVLQKIVDYCDEKKIVTYENRDDLFFILSPLKTKTFSNEVAALEVAEHIKIVLKDYNRRFKQKIDFGISVNRGELIAKVENGVFHFMSLGTLISSSKKIASLSSGDVLLDENVKNKLGRNVKVEEHDGGKINYYSLLEVKRKNEDHEKFIKNFLKGLEKK